jgi:hypothetical protein
MSIVLGVIAAIGVVGVLFVFFGVINGGGEERVAPAGGGDGIESVQEASDSDLTMGQQQAVKSAQGYLDMAGFSRKALIDQLAYEEFGQADAEFAVDYIAPDWNAEAAESAQGYLDMGGFSRQGLIDQLIYEGFSQAQAEYGVKAVGY